MFAFLFIIYTSFCSLLNSCVLFFRRRLTYTNEVSFVPAGQQVSGVNNAISLSELLGLKGIICVIIVYKPHTDTEHLLYNHVGGA